MMAKANGASSEIVEARREVELAKEDFLKRARVAREISERLVRRVAGSARPAFLLLAGLGALALAVGIYKLARPRPRPNEWRRPERRSLLGEVLRSALVSAAARFAATAVARVPVPQLGAAQARPDKNATPEKPKPMSMPEKHGFRLDQKDGAPPMPSEACQEDHEPTLVRLEARARSRACGDDELLAQKRVLGDELLAQAERVSGEDRRRPRRRANGGVHTTHCAGDDASTPSTKRGQHATHCREPREPFKSCSARVPARSCGGCDW